MYIYVIITAFTIIIIIIIIFITIIIVIVNLLNVTCVMFWQKKQCFPFTVLDNRTLFLVSCFGC